MQFDPIGVVHSCFDEKFGIPRQPGLVPEARATIEILPPFDRDEAFRGLESFSHIWVLFHFHANKGYVWKPTVRPPRLGGNQRVGVFASRSGFRPNPLGMSVVCLEGIERSRGKLLVAVSGIDLMDGTPVLDIKPYLPWADSLPDAAGGYAPEKPDSLLSIEFAPQAREVCNAAEMRLPGFSLLVTQILQGDPRPAYHGGQSTDRVFGMKLHGYEIRWTIDILQKRVCVVSVASDDNNTLGPG